MVNHINCSRKRPTPISIYRCVWIPVKCVCTRIRYVQRCDTYVLFSITVFRLVLLVRLNMFSVILIFTGVWGSVIMYFSINVIRYKQFKYFIYTRHRTKVFIRSLFLPFCQSTTEPYSYARLAEVFWDVYKRQSQPLRDWARNGYPSVSERQL